MRRLRRGAAREARGRSAWHGAWQGACNGTWHGAWHDAWQGAWHGAWHLRANKGEQREEGQHSRGHAARVEHEQHPGCGVPGWSHGGGIGDLARAHERHRSLFGTQATRAFISGPEGSAEQAGGPLERWMAAWAAGGKGNIDHAGVRE